MKVGLIPNPEKEGAKTLAEAAIKLLSESGAEVFLPVSGYNAPNAPVCDEEQLFSESDVIITVGGDGTIIQHAKRAAVLGKPVLGINAGRVGFLADIERDNIELLRKLVTGDYIVSPRFMLSVSVYRDGKETVSGIALNDAVISSGRVSQLCDLELCLSSDTISYHGDGIIVATPTGSTAYSMSAGGPVISPNVRCFSVTPICSHSLTARPFIIGEESCFAVRIPKNSSDTAVLSLDGREYCSIDCNAEVIVKKAPWDAKLINISGREFTETLSQKFR